MKYKINHWRCFLYSYKDTKCAFFDWLDNEYIGKIFAYALYYLSSIALFPIFIILSLIWYIKRVIKIKKNMFNSSAMNTLKQMKIIIEKELKGKVEDER